MAGYKVLALTQEHFTGWFRGEHPAYTIVKYPLPPDAKVHSMHRNPKNGELEFVIFSETYPWVKPGLPLPFVQVPMAEVEK